MPIIPGYTRGYHHTKSRGRESQVLCSYCGRRAPRYKCIPSHRGFRITDPTILREVERSAIHTFNLKQYACPACARYNGIVRKKQY